MSENANDPNELDELNELLPLRQAAAEGWQQAVQQEAMLLDRRIWLEHELSNLQNNPSARDWAREAEQQIKETLVNLDADNQQQYLIFQQLTAQVQQLQSLGSIAIAARASGPYPISQPIAPTKTTPTTRTVPRVRNIQPLLRRR